ncbi:MAG: cytochrome P450 [Pseudomonadota bacterium]
MSENQPAASEINWWAMLTDPEHIRNPYPELKQIRERSPIHHDPKSDVYFVLGHREFSLMSKATELGRDTRPWKHGWCTEENKQRDPISYALFSEFQRQMVNSNPPEHQRMRAVYKQAFRAEKMDALRTMIRTECDHLLDTLPLDTPFDFMTAFANHLPLRVVRNLFEIPPEMDEKLAHWNAALIKIGDILMTPEQKDKALSALREFKDYVRDFLAERRENPGDGMIGLALAAHEDGSLDEEETINNLVGLISGNETTVTLLGNGLYLFLRYPEEMARLRADRNLMDTAVNEILRYEPGINFILRVGIEDYQCGDRLIPAGSMAIGLVSAINRDPAQFTAPDTFDVSRQPNRQLIFGGGAHHCIGAALARAQGEVAFDAILDRFGKIELVEKPEWWMDRTNQRGLRNLPLRVAN